MLGKKVMVALDCGNSSFRVVLGEYNGDKLKSHLVKQLPNRMIRIGDYFYWDVLYIFEEFKNILKEIAVDYHIDSIGVCTWGVDFALFDKKGNMISNPLSYRNVIGAEALENLSENEKKELFRESGILCDKINSIYMLLAMKSHFSQILEIADKCLMIPDIFNYFLTGIMQNEPSELSTTQIMSVGKEKISKKICKDFGIDENLFGPIGRHGTLIGNVKKDILEEIEVDYDIPVICVPSHDTASAVLAIPAKEKNFGFVSCGTWSLIGTELDEPIINDDIEKANLTNEQGGMNKITLLKNSAGMYVVNRLKQEYEFELGTKVAWDEITEMSEKCEEIHFVDLDDNDLFNPPSMNEALLAKIDKENKISKDKKWPILFRCFYESLARNYASTFEMIEKSINNNLEVIYMVGGGTASSILLKLTGKYTNKKIIVCNGESTSIGNLATQIKYFDKTLELKDIRKIIGNSYDLKIV